MTDIQQVAEHPEVLVPLNDNKAKLLDERIRRMADTARGNLETVGHLLDEARDGQIHVTLGFKSWPAYVADALGGRMELSSESLKAVVALMAGQGMSERVIADATGASKTTIHRDIEEVVHNGPPRSFTVTHAEGPSLRDAISTEPRTRPTPVALQQDDESDAPTVTGKDGKTYRKPNRKPKGKGDKAAPRRPNARKAVERIAPHLSGLAVAVSELDPGEVNAEELQAEIASIAESLGTIRKFVDGVGVPESAGRRPQVLTVFRDKVQDLAPIIVDLEELTKDSRWPKTAARFNRRDRLDLDATITALQNLRAAVGEVYNVTPTNDVITPEMLDTAADPVED